MFWSFANRAWWRCSLDAGHCSTASRPRYPAFLCQVWRIPFRGYVSTLRFSCYVLQTILGCHPGFLFVYLSCSVLSGVFQHNRALYWQHILHLLHSTLSQSTLCWTVSSTAKWKFWPVILKSPKQTSCRDIWSWSPGGQQITWVVLLPPETLEIEFASVLMSHNHNPFSS